MQQVANPFMITLGLDGLALELGYIYIGVENEDPETSPKDVFWDEAATAPATQPIRTLASYPDRSGSPGQIWTSGKYSIRVRNSLGEQVFYLASAGSSETVNEGDPYYVHVCFLGDAPSINQVVGKHVFPIAVTFEADLPDQAFFEVGTDPASDCVFDMTANDVSFGTLTIDTSGDVTVDSNEQDFAIGDVFKLVAPASSTTCADIGGTIVGSAA